ncbi:hypothetical protein [Microbacterium sp.]|uniref:hypothetical protein n=1 Tax=Microbacterium sp. TaxID=51671 RepID=UPI0028119FE4|nr:hypothetical protein [Microbacterium sp.]
MTTPASHSAVRTDGVPDRRASTRIRVGQVLLTILFAMCAAVSLSTMFADDPFDASAVVLIASFGCLAAVLGAAATWSLRRAPTLWWALWALPAFFVWHVAALGTWVPDAVLAVVGAVALLLCAPSARRG